MPDVTRRVFVRGAGMLMATGVSLAVGAGALAGVDEGLFAGINRVRDPANMTGTELHHVPAIAAVGKAKKGEPFEVMVSVGAELHVMTPEHRITELTLLADNEPVSTVLFSSVTAQPRVMFSVRLDGSTTLVAIARCNLHGLWEGSLEVVPV